MYTLRWDAGGRGGFEAFLTNNQKVITAIIDVRGSGGQSNEYKFEVYRKLGAKEIQDIFSVTKFLSKKYDNIDTDRVGIYGASYGGFLTAMTLDYDTDSLFSCGISGI